MKLLINKAKLNNKFTKFIEPGTYIGDYYLKSPRPKRLYIKQLPENTTLKKARKYACLSY
jgi:hypothetical protein